MTNTSKLCQDGWVWGRGWSRGCCPLPTCHHLDFNANKDMAGLSTHKAKVNTEMEVADTVTHTRLKGNPDDFSFPMFILLSVIAKGWGPASRRLGLYGLSVQPPRKLMRAVGSGMGWCVCVRAGRCGVFSHPGGMYVVWWGWDIIMENGHYVMLSLQRDG